MTETPSPQSADEPQRKAGVMTNDGEKVVIVTPDGMGVADVEAGDDGAGVSGAGDDGTGGPGGNGEGGSNGKRQPNPADLVEQPAKVMRIGSMVKSLLEEVRNAPLDDAGRAHLAQVHSRSIAELKEGLAPELVEELDRIALPFSDENPTDAELRIAQAQLVGWLEGLFHGIQTALVAQQMAAQAQLQQMRQLPPGMTQPGGMPAPGHSPTSPSPSDRPSNEGTGQYL